MKALLLTVAALMAVATSLVIAHSGGLDAYGCHTNRKTGDYHCHRSPAPSRPHQLLPSAGAKPSSQPPVAKTVPAPANNNAVSLSERQIIVSVQLLLISLGYSPGKADGSMEAATREAIAKFQSDHFMEPSGNVSGDLLVRLAESVQKR